MTILRKDRPILLKKVPKKYYVAALLLLLLMLLMFVLRRHSAELGQNAQSNLHNTNAADSSDTFGVSKQHVKAGLPDYIRFSETTPLEYDRQSEYILMGRVEDQNGNFLEGAVVSLYKSYFSHTLPNEWPSPISSQVCDILGQFRFILNGPFHGYLRVYKTGYSSKEDTVAFRSLTTVVKNYVLPSAEACAEGIITDQFGQAMSGVLVFASGFSSPTSLDLSLFSPITSKTDRNGRYTVSGLPERLCSIVAMAPEYVISRKSVELKSRLDTGSCQRVDFVLTRGTVVSIVVKSSDGNSVPGAFCTRGRADMNGVIMFTVPKESAPFAISIDAKGYKSKRVMIDPQQMPSITTLVTLDDGPAIILRGKVQDEDKQPLENVIISLYEEPGYSADDYGIAITDKSGHFEIILYHILPIFELFASKDGYIPQISKVDAKTTSPSAIMITMNRVQAGFYGRVIDESGIPVKRIRIYIERAGKADEDPMFRYFENEDGSFCVMDILPDLYNISISAISQSPRDRKKPFLLEKVEIKKGFLLGEILVKLKGLEK